MKRLLRLLALLVFVLGACAGETLPMDSEVHPDADGHADFAFGEPADPRHADRVIELTATEQNSFEPGQFTVAVGETVTFRIANPGIVTHDFTLGDQAAQEEHAAIMMGSMPMAHTDANAILLPPGETHELTWRFTVPGTVLIGCHQPGHWEVGMRATIVVG